MILTLIKKGNPNDENKKTRTVSGLIINHIQEGKKKTNTEFIVYTEENVDLEVLFNIVFDNAVIASKLPADNIEDEEGENNRQDLYRVCISKGISYEIDCE